MHRTQTGSREGWQRACQGPSDTDGLWGRAVPCDSHMPARRGFVCSQSM